MSEHMSDFISLYITLLRDYQKEIQNRHCERVYSALNRHKFSSIFLLFCIVDGGYFKRYQAEVGSIEKGLVNLHQIKSEADKFFECNLSSGRTYSLKKITVSGRRPVKNFSRQMLFACQLLLCMHLSEYGQTLSNDTKRMFKYLISVPLDVLCNESIDNEVNKISKKNGFSCELGMEVLDEFFSMYEDILKPLEFDEYRVDFVRVKSAYENFFWRYRFNVKQGQWNILS